MNWNYNQFFRSPLVAFYAFIHSDVLCGVQKKRPRVTITFADRWNDILIAI